MAKALFGHMGGSEARLVHEIARLRTRIADLESLVEHLELERTLALPAAETISVERLQPVSG